MVGCLATAPRSRTQLPCVPRQTTLAAGDFERFSLPRQGHLRRLDSIWIDSPIYFITSCTESRRRVLANRDTLAVLREEFETAPKRYGWTIGRYVVMPDHLHLFCAPRDLAFTIEKWTAYWKSRFSRRHVDQSWTWQRACFHHRLRDARQYAEKLAYVRENPLRKKLVVRPEDWPYQGKIHELRW